MKLVLDTNVVLSALLVPGLCRELVRKRCHGHERVTSEPLLRELDRTLSRRFGCDPLEVPFLEVYRRRAACVAPAPLTRRVCRDPDDDVVLATALAAGADAIVTGDRDLLVLGAFKGIRILSPRDFLNEAWRGGGAAEAT